jgi:hypothetical protein
MTIPIHSAISPTGQRSQQLHSILDSDAATYSISGIISGFVGQTIQINGNSSNIVRVTRIEVALTAAASAISSIQIQRTSTTAIGGSPSAFLVAKHDTTDPNNVSGVNSYASAPTQGTPLGSPLRSASVGIAATGSLVQVQGWEFGFGPKKAILVRNGEFLAIVLGANSTGSSMSVVVEWTESTT